MDACYVSFPGLGLKFNITQGFMLFGRPVYWYGVIICTGMIICMLLGMRFCKKYNLTRDDVLDYVIAGVPSGIIGARLYYVIFQWQYYKNDFLSVFKIWEGGLAIYGGVIAAAIAILVVSRFKKHRFLHITDFVFPYIMLGQCIGRWGNFFNQEAYGRETTSIFGMTGNIIEKAMGKNVLVHPTFFYESLWCFIGFILIALYRSKLQKKYGEVTALYMVIYGLERAVVEGLRTDSLMMKIGNFDIRVSQILSMILVVIGIALFIDSRLRGSDVVRTYDSKEAEKVKEAERIEREGSSIMDVINNLESGESATEVDESGASETDNAENAENNSEENNAENANTEKEITATKEEE